MREFKVTVVKGNGGYKVKDAVKDICDFFTDELNSVFLKEEESYKNGICKYLLTIAGRDRKPFKKTIFFNPMLIGDIKAVVRDIEKKLAEKEEYKMTLEEAERLLRP